MAKLEYEKSLVDQTLDILASAKEPLEDIESDMSSALGIILGARGVEELDTSGISKGTSAPDQCIQEIDKNIQLIQEKAEAIVKYNEEIDSMGVTQRLFSTLAFGTAKFTEGFFKAGEQIVDGFASVLGMAAGIFSPSAKEKIGNFIEKDHVGDAF